MGPLSLSLLLVDLFFLWFGVCELCVALDGPLEKLMQVKDIVLDQKKKTLRRVLTIVVVLKLRNKN